MINFIIFSENSLNKNQLGIGYPVMTMEPHLSN